MSQTAVYDACVLYPASLRSFLMWLGVHELVRPRWSEQILDDFPTDQLEPFGLEAVHPDDFVHPLIDTSPRRVLLCLRDEAAIRKNPDRSIHDVLDSLRDRGLRKSSDTMRELVEGTS